MALRQPLSSFVDLNLVHRPVVTEFDLKDAKVLGEGMCGAVFKVNIPGQPGEVAALKLFRNGSGGSSTSDPRLAEERLEKMFRTEVNVMRQCQHPNVMTMLCCLSMADSLCVMMPHMSGGSLGKAIHSLTMQQTTKYFFEIANAVKYLHQKKIVHGDIKPNNILLSADDQAVLTDFGLSRCVPNHNVQLFVDYGTRGYMAPETDGGARVSPFSVDMFALGVTLWAMSLKRKPKRSTNYLEHMRRASLTPSLKHLLESLLQKEPSLRATAAQVVERRLP